MQLSCLYLHVLLEVSFLIAWGKQMIAVCAGTTLSDMIRPKKSTKLKLFSKFSQVISFLSERVCL